MKKSKIQKENHLVNYSFNECLLLAYYWTVGRFYFFISISIFAVFDEESQIELFSMKKENIKM